jgi:outer membrane protein assembly factor BamE (lipoprotein component of BamABCDE complex)
MKECMLKFSILFVLLALSSCEAPQQKFNRKEWNHIDGSYNHRDLMIQDLMKNVLHKGMSYKELEKIVGKPNEQSFSKKVTYELYYNFNQEERRELIIYFSNDSCITNFARVSRKNN